VGALLNQIISMKVEIRGVADSGTHEKERLILDVKEDDNIGDYLITDTSYTSDGKVSNKLRHPYWFIDKKVKKGDVVVLYTKKGNYSETKNANGSTTYFYYWGLDSSVWNNDKDCAVIMHIDEWNAKSVK
jgi:hypothetical protein